MQNLFTYHTKKLVQPVRVAVGWFATSRFTRHITVHRPQTDTRRRLHVRVRHAAAATSDLARKALQPLVEVAYMECMRAHLVRASRHERVCI